MKTKIYVFEENSITFVLDKDSKVMVNATEMAKVFNKQVNEFMSNETTKNFIGSCLKNGNSRFLNIEREEDLYVSRQKSGTWMHRVLALKFAAWLNPDFEVWVYSTIDQLLFGKYAEREKSLERTVALQNEQNLLAARPNKTGADFDRYLAIGYELHKERGIRKNLTKESISEMADLFEDHEI
jgi:hypothetical protein